ncbi:hypothetical protein SAMN04515673_105129 [Poseidonocella sedimentorum]|uniref:Uncharacterized protein n=1 Tax=Poseidonocella sedimentorum TaxID=871652 RepID=A0A1I6DTK6_9RHOB|nr:hypothetical protein SAMN04515673_105129 [Poseidonocella sedimentorum]
MIDAPGNRLTDAAPGAIHVNPVMGMNGVQPVAGSALKRGTFPSNEGAAS